MKLSLIGRVKTEFPEKFGVPKQPGLAANLRGVIELTGEWAHESYLRGLEECSHLWVIFIFHLNSPILGSTVRPPILGGVKRMGIFSTRSPHRPNPIGLSLVKIEKIDFEKCLIHISGHDFVSETPIVDLKPYIASYDCPRSQSFHWSEKLKTAPLNVSWGCENNQLSKQQQAAIEEVLSLDPRPRSAKQEAIFGMSFEKWNIKFQTSADGLMIIDITKIP